MVIKKFVLVFFIFLSLGFIFANDTSLSPSDASVVVDSSAPQITILSPLNQTYNNALPILVNYSIVDPTLDSVWYSLNGTPNVTISGAFYLNLSEGFFHLVIYANDSFSRMNFSEVYFTTEYSPLPFCGDGQCNGGEVCDVCVADCGGCTSSSSSSTSSSGSSGTSGGGGGRGLDFSLDKNLIIITLKQGETKRETLSVFNDGVSNLDFVVEQNFSESLLVISETSFSLAPGESKEINLDFFSRENELPDIYVGRLIIKERRSGLNLTSNLVLGVKGKDALFDLRADVSTKELSPGEEVKTRIDLFNLGDLRDIDFLLIYSIKDFKGNVLTSKEESLAVNDTLTIFRTLEVPKDAEFGMHLFYVKMSYQDKIATSSSWFTVEEKGFIQKHFSWSYLLLYFLIVIIILGIVFRKKIFEKVKEYN